MASASQFLLEDQTDDEDFFDKLVDDTDSPIEPHALSSAKQLKFDHGGDSDETKAFSNLSIANDSVGDIAALNEADTGKDGANDGASSSVGQDELSSLQFVNTDANKLQDDELRSEVPDVPISEIVKGTKKVREPRNPEVKKLDWGSFDADSSVFEGHGFGSYSDFFNELERTSENLQGNAKEDGALGDSFVSNDTKNIGVGLDISTGAEKHQGEVQHDSSSGQYIDHLVYNDTNNISVGLVNSRGFEQHQGEVNHDFASEQCVDNNQSWENLYPGWKYDENTSQWYQLDGHDTSLNSHESYDNSTNNWNSMTADSSSAAFLEQSTTSVGDETVENVSTNNQVSQVGNGYPEHMVFDEQYPGWYYDTISQEWCSLDDYNHASQTTGIGQAREQQAQNGHAFTDIYHSNNESNMYKCNDTKETFKGQECGIQSQHGSWDQSYYSDNQQATNIWQPETAGNAEAAVTSASFTNFGGNQQRNNLYSERCVAEQFKPNESFIPHHMNVAGVSQNGPMSFSNDLYSRQNSVDYSQQSYQSQHLFSPAAERSPDGRPSHALVNFGFGGKLTVMKENNGSLQDSFGSQKGTGESYISVLNLGEVISGSASNSSLGENSLSYFNCLDQQSLPGPLIGGNVGSKDLHKWLDERILKCESSDMDFSKGKLLKMLLSLLKISCQFYGKLRSPFGTDVTQRETDSAEVAIAELLAFAKKDGYAPFSQCLQQLPHESQMQVTGLEVQNLLASGKKMEALQCAQEGHLWGAALVIAAQLGQQFYVDTVKQMALRQLSPGSPLRTLCLLVAGQPAEVFCNGSNFPGSVNVSQQQLQVGSNSMLDNWEENLGIISANRTTDDELVITHLGDCMWKERGEIIAAHICYLIADKNFDSYSDSARLCLVGADHWKYPRTYASPEAIQRTELYEYSKTLGNSQYILLPFQPYKVIYAYMLAEVGKLSAAQKYCQAVLKCQKTGRSPEAETWKQMVLSLEERIRIHQQGGYTTNLAPAKLVGKLLNFFDSTAHRVVGGMPPPAPHSTTGNLQVNGYNHQQQEASKLPYSQSVNTMSSLMAPASMEPIHESGGNSKRMAVHTRSVSEPDFFGRTPIQDMADSKDKVVDGVTHLKSSGSVTGSRFSRFGFGILKDTVGRVLQVRSSKEAKLGAENQFYYDEKLKRWVERGVDPPAEEAALPPPPTASTFQSNSSGFTNKYDMNPSNGSWSSGGATPSENSSGIPPISQGSNQFLARGRMGVRARYVDTFNPGHGNSHTMFQAPSVQSAKPPIPSKAKFFIPATPASSSNDQVMESATAETGQEEYSTEEVAASAGAQQPMTMQRFPSMDNLQMNGSGTNFHGDHHHHHHPASRRTASWGGNFNTSFTPPTSPSTFKPILLNGSLGEELQEVEL